MRSSPRYASGRTRITTEYLNHQSYTLCPSLVSIRSRLTTKSPSEPTSTATDFVTAPRLTMRSISMSAAGLGMCFSLVHAKARKPVRLPLAVGPRLLQSGSSHRSCDCVLLSAHCLVKPNFCPSRAQSLDDTQRQ